MSISVGAQRFGVSRRYDTGDGAVIAAMAGRWYSTPAQNCAPVAEPKGRRRRGSPDGPPRRCRLMWMWTPLPTPSGAGIGENIARWPTGAPRARAISRVITA